MLLEFDPQKSDANQAKHGLPLDRARQLLNDPDLIVIRARTLDEPRWLAIGRIDGRVWAAVITYRGSATRVISLRRARASEVEIYEGS